MGKRYLAEDRQALYDVNSSYYEGRSCPLARSTTAPSLSVAVRAHPGDTADPNTLLGEVERLRGDFGLERVVLHRPAR